MYSELSATSQVATEFTSDVGVKVDTVIVQQLMFPTFEDLPSLLMEGDPLTPPAFALTPVPSISPWHHKTESFTLFYSSPHCPVHIGRLRRDNPNNIPSALL